MNAHRRLALGLAALWTAVVCYLALTASRRVLGLPDELAEPAQHFVSFAILAALLALAFPGRWALIAGSLAVGGIAGEFLQLTTATRTFDPVDIVMDLAGIACGLGVIALVAPDRLAVPVLGAACASLLAGPFLLIVENPPITAFPAACASAPPAAGGDPLLLLDLLPSSDPPLTPNPSVAELKASLSETNEWAIDLWFETPNLAQSGPARVFTISEGIEQDQVNVHVGVDGDSLSVRWRTSCEWFNQLLVPAVIEPGDPQHVVVNWSGGVLETWVDGVLANQTAMPWGDLSAWDPDFQIAIGDEVGGRRAFGGTVHSVTMWDRALSGDVIAERGGVPPT